VRHVKSLKEMEPMPRAENLTGLENESSRDRGFQQSQIMALAGPPAAVQKANNS
jgi:hypothetical protein